MVPHIIPIILQGGMDRISKDKSLDRVSCWHTDHGILKNSIKQNLFRNDQCRGGTAKKICVKIINHQRLYNPFFWWVGM